MREVKVKELIVLDPVHFVAIDEDGMLWEWSYQNNVLEWRTFPNPSYEDSPAEKWVLSHPIFLMYNKCVHERGWANELKTKTMGRESNTLTGLCPCSLMRRSGGFIFLRPWEAGHRSWATSCLYPENRRRGNTDTITRCLCECKTGEKSHSANCCSDKVAVDEYKSYSVYCALEAPSFFYVYSWFTYTKTGRGRSNQ